MDATSTLASLAANQSAQVSERQQECEELMLKQMIAAHTAGITGGTPATAAPGEAHCPVDWDRIQCWPESQGGAYAVIACFEELRGVLYDHTQNASRWCHNNGTWDNYSNYSECRELPAAPPESSEEDDYSSTLFFTGYCLSLGALSVAVWIFLYFKDLRCLRNTIHTNLMFTYIFNDALWILTVILQNVVHMNMASCVILMGLLHYFYLTNFFWMFVEGLYLYMLVVATFTGENIKLRVYVIIGWCAPVVLILVWAIAKCFAHSPSDSQADSTGLQVCPMIAPDDLDWIHQGPVIGLLAMNLVFLIMIMWVLITKLRSANTVETQQYRKATKALLVLFPLLGITYILIFSGPRGGLSGSIFKYTRAVLLSLQGFTVALFYCFLNTEVQNAVRHHVERWKTARSVGGGRRYTYSGHSKDWSPRSRTESIRLGDMPYGGSLCGGPAAPYRKRESTASETTTTTLLGPPLGNGGRLSNGSGSAVRAAACPYLLGEENAV